MTKLQQDLTMFAGDTMNIEFAVDNLTASDLSNAQSIQWNLAQRDASSNALVKSSGSGISTADTNVIVSLSPADTANLTPMTYIHHLVIQKQDGSISTLAVGQLTIRKSLVQF